MGSRTSIYGMIKDVGELSKLLMVKGGYRKDTKGEVKKKLEHELADILYSVLVLSNKLDVDLKESFWETMNNIEEKINKN